MIRCFCVVSLGYYVFIIVFLCGVYDYCCDLYIFKVGYCFVVCMLDGLVNFEIFEISVGICQLGNFCY